MFGCQIKAIKKTQKLSNGILCWILKLYPTSKYLYIKMDKRTYFSRHKYHCEIIKPWKNWQKNAFQKLSYKYSKRF